MIYRRKVIKSESLHPLWEERDDDFFKKVNGDEDFFRQKKKKLFLLANNHTSLFCYNLELKIFYRKKKQMEIFSQ